MNTMTRIRLEKAARDNGFDLPSGNVDELRFWSCCKPSVGTVELAEDEHGFTVRNCGMTYRCPTHQDVWARLRTIYLVG